MVGCIAFGILFAFLFSLDIVVKGNFKNSFIKQLVLLTGSVFNLFNSHMGMGMFKYWDNFFYPSFAITTICAVTGYVLYIRNEMIKSLPKEYHAQMHIFHLLSTGLKAYQAEGAAIRRKLEAAKIDHGKHMIEYNSKYRPEITKFIREIFEAIHAKPMDSTNDTTNYHDDESTKKYIGFVMNKFVTNFVGLNNARFSSRRLTNDNLMEVEYTTDLDNIPGYIDLNHSNLIKESLKQRKPIFYSENSKSHFSTNNNSIINGIYVDYVSFCLEQTKDKKPFFSICLDIKEEDQKEKIKGLVDSLIFDVLCTAIKLKLSYNLAQHAKVNQS